MSKLSVREFIGPVGDAAVTRDGDNSNKIVSIEIAIEGRLQSYRDRMFNHPNGIVRDAMIHRAGSVWLQKILCLGVRPDLEALQKQCALDRVCIKLTAWVNRRFRIRDPQKNLTTGFDHMILDPLVKAGILIDDDSENIIWEAKPYAEDGGPRMVEHVSMLFEPSEVRCRESVTTQVLEFGWPDPAFRKIEKSKRREIIRRRLKHARS